MAGGGHRLGAHNAISEFGGVPGIAVMGAIFAARGGYGPTRTLCAAQHFVDGLRPAVWPGAAVLPAASPAMRLVPNPRKKAEIA